MADNLAPADVYDSIPRRRGSRIPTGVWLVLLVAAAVGGYLAHDRLPISLPGTQQHAASVRLVGGTTLSESQLDDPVATYVVGDETFEVTARDAILQGSSLDTVRSSDGTYAMPSAESVLSAARTAIVAREAEARGVTVSDEELDAYTEQTFGTTDYASIATGYTMDEETVRARLRESAAMAKLREQVVTTDAGDPPVPPASPENGDLYATSADYAAYLIGLAGDEWNAETGDWARTDGPYYEALRDYDIHADSASYTAAQTAYYVAYQLHSSEATSAQTEWTTFVNDLLGKAELRLSSLVS